MRVSQNATARLPKRSRPSSRSLRCLAAAGTITLAGQGGGGPGGQGGPAGPGRERAGPGGGARRSAANLPTTPTAVALPTMSAGGHRPGTDVRLGAVASARQGSGALRLRGEGVLRLRHGQRPAVQDAHRRAQAGRTARAFSGLVLAESMHGSGAAHMFEFTSIYTMSSGHAAVEILTTSPMQFVQQNEARYKRPSRSPAARPTTSSRRSARSSATGRRSAALPVAEDGARGHVA